MNNIWNHCYENSDYERGVFCWHKYLFFQQFKIEIVDIQCTASFKFQNSGFLKFWTFTLLLLGFGTIV